MNKLKHLYQKYFLTVLNTVFFLGTVYVIVVYRSENKELLQSLQILLIPVTYFGIVFGVQMNIQNRRRHLDLEKIKMTNQFVKDFRKIMKDLDAITGLKRRYYAATPELSSIQKNIENSDRHHFDMDYFDKINSDTKKTYEEINKLIRVTEYNKSKEINHALDSYIFCCLKYNSLEIYNPNNAVFDKIEKYKVSVDEINKRPYKSVEKDGNKKERDNKAKFEKEKRGLLEQEKRFLAISLREADTDILNEMECLLLNVNFDLLNYEQIYYLVYSPFEYYMDVFYLDIIFSYLNGKKKGQEIFSNIRIFYTEIFKIHEEKTKDNKKNIEKKRDEEIVRVNKQKKVVQ